MAGLSDNWISVLRIVEEQEKKSREDGQIYTLLSSIATAARSVSRLAPLVRFQTACV